MESARSDSRPILALDVGQARVGIASWDSRRGIRDEAALRRVSLSEDVRRLTAIARERGAGLVLVGLPLNADGSSGPQARLTGRFAKALSNAVAALGIAVETADETDTSVEAMNELDLDHRPLNERERAAVDSRSAAILLRRYLRKVTAPSSLVAGPTGLE